MGRIEYPKNVYKILLGVSFKSNSTQNQLVR